MVSATSCSACPAGSSCATTTVSPVACAAGQYALGSATSCTDCAAGSACATTGLSGGTACSAGLYSPASGYSVCLVRGLWNVGATDCRLGAAYLFGCVCVSMCLCVFVCVCVRVCVCVCVCRVASSLSASVVAWCARTSLLFDGSRVCNCVCVCVFVLLLRSVCLAPSPRGPGHRYARAAPLAPSLPPAGVPRAQPAVRRGPTR